MKGFKRPELLAPAGSYESFLCAVGAGADAVYLAGKSFGARAYAGNFSEEELLRALDYAHLNQRKVYITINTLFKDEEIALLYDFIKPYYEEGLDGVIVQDFGVLSFIKREFPLLPIHASTQMTVTSVYGARALQELGVKRVVPARELTLPEVKKITETGIETECFIHGALCYCYSGQCLFSSLIGGRSGNRGRCAQPCRLSYQTENGKAGYYLSLKDLCTIEYLPELIKAGIQSFKIEGRMKNPAYVYRVTELYDRYIREFLDRPEKEYQVKKGDREFLEHFYVRTGVGKGYYEGNRGRDMITMDTPGYAGSSEEGSRELVEESGKENLPVKIKATALFEVGKPCEIHFTEPKEYKFTGPICEEARKAPLTEEELIKRLGKTGDTLFRFETLEVRTEGNIFLPVSVLNDFRRQALEEYRKVLLDGCRREAGGKASLEKELSEEVLSEKDSSGKALSGKKSANQRKEKSGTQSYIVFVKTEEQLRICLAAPFYKEIALPLSLACKEGMDSLLKISGKRIDICLPEIIREPEGQEERIKEALEHIAEKVNINKFYVNQLDSLFLCTQCLPEIPCSGDIHFYQMNHEAVHCMEDKIRSFTLSPELNKEELKGLKDVNGELMVYGRLPLMNTYNCLRLTDGKCSKTEGFTTLKDRKGAILPIFCHCNEKICYNTIYNSVPTCLTRYGRELSETGAEALQIRFTDEDSKRTGEVLHMFECFEPYGERITPEFPYTNGHFVRGIE